MDIEHLIRRLGTARNARSTWDNTLQIIADRVWPLENDFTTVQSQGALRTELMLDSTAALASQKAAAALHSFTTPGNQKYQRLTTDNDDLNKSQAVKRYLDDMTDRLFRARYSPLSAFESQWNAALLQFAIFGTGAVMISERPPKMGRPAGLEYKALHLGNYWIQEDAGGMVDTFHRCWMWTLRQVDQQWPDKLPPMLAERMKKNPDELIEVAHTVCPRTDYDPGRPDHSSLPWASCYYLPDRKHLLDEGGYAAWPFAVMRYMTSPGEIYGRSPAWMALSNIRVLNTMKETLLDSAQKRAEPPLIAADDGLLPGFSTAPGKINYGGLQNGVPQVQPLEMGGDVGVTLEMMDKEREIVGANFYLDVFRALIENPQMTATQALEIVNERATMMAPVVGRIESGGLGPMTMRELQLLGEAGEIPPMPPELMEAEGEFKIEYTSPARKAMRAPEGVAIVRTMEAVIPMAQVDQTVLDAFDIPEMGRELAEINGVPAKCIRDAEEIKARKEQRATQEQAAQLLEAAPVISDTAANLVRLQQARGVPQV